MLKGSKLQSFSSIAAPPVPPMSRELLSPEDNITSRSKRRKRRGSKSSQESVKVEGKLDDEIY